MRRLQPDDPEIESILDAAERLLDEGDPEAAVGLCETVLANDPMHAGALFLSAEAMHELGLFHESEARYRACTQLAPEHPLSWSGLALSLFDQGQDAESLKTVQRALRVSDTNAEAYWVRALLRESKRDSSGAARDFRRAFRLHPGRFDLPVNRSAEEVIVLFQTAVAALPPLIREWVMAFELRVTDLPSRTTCDAFEPPRSPADLLFAAFMHGYPVDPAAVPPPPDTPEAGLTLMLYRCNFQRLTADPETLMEEITSFIFEEFGLERIEP